MLPIRTILHATDFSERAGDAFQLACVLAQDYDARLIVLHVHEPPPPPIIGEFGYMPPDVGPDRASLRGRLAELRPSDPRIAVEHELCEGDPAAEILRLAQKRQCDLIVMGTHGRTGLDRLLMGSVAEAVLRKAPCPVLTVKAPLAKHVPTITESVAEKEFAI
jgi:nucleotide-binding universal stress UspA family protein